MAAPRTSSSARAMEDGYAPEQPAVHIGSHPEKENESELGPTGSIHESSDDNESIHSHASTTPTVANDEKNGRPATLSRTISVIPEAVIVPRAERRGLLARFALVPEVQNPYHYSQKTKFDLSREKNGTNRARER